MRILSVIVLFSTIFLQTNLVYGDELSDLLEAAVAAAATENKVDQSLENLGGIVGDGDNSILDDIEIKVKLDYIIPNVNEVQHYSFVVVTDATKLLQQNSKYQEQMFYIEFLFDIKYKGSSTDIWKDYTYEIKPASVSNQSALKQLALDIQNQIEREPNAIYLINVKPKYILETPKIDNTKFNLRITFKHNVPGSNVKTDFTFEVLTDGGGMIPDYIKEIEAKQLQLQKTYNCSLADLDIEYHIVVINYNSVAIGVAPLISELIESQPFSSLHITAENSGNFEETGNFEEYTIQAVIDFQISHSGESFTRKVEITTNSSIPLDTKEIQKQLNEIKKNIVLGHGVSHTSLNYEVSLFVTGVDIKESFVDIKKTLETIRSLIDVELNSNSFRLFRLTALITHKPADGGKEILYNFQVLSDGVSPLNKSQVVENLNDANNFLSKYGATFSRDTTSFSVRIDYAGEPSKQELEFLDKLSTEIQEVLKDEVTKLTSESQPKNPKEAFVLTYTDSKTGIEYKETFEIELVESKFKVSEFLKNINLTGNKLVEKYGLSTLELKTAAEIHLEQGGCHA